MADNAIEFSGVCKSFRRQDGSVQHILNDVDFTIPAGKTTVVAGGSGQGKSVTLKLILRLMDVDSGAIVIDGEDITRFRGKKLHRLRTRFGVLFQGAALFDSLTVFENVAMPLRERTANGLARAMQLHPEIMLFDEPTTGLDPVMSQEIYHLFARTQRQYGFTSIIVSHDIPKVFNLADQVIILDKGRVDVFDSPEAIQWSDKENIRKFVKTTMGEIYQSHLIEK